MCDIIDNVARVLEMVVPHVAAHWSQCSTQAGQRPFILALSGLQGSGKSTWASSIVRTLNDDHNIHAITISVDDLYKTHDELVALRNADPNNKLLRTRGQPGTHDEVLAVEVFKSLADGATTDFLLPSFDKSKFNGEGDRVPEAEWQRIPRKRAIEVVVFEGWCIGFQALPLDLVQQKWKEANQSHASDMKLPTVTLSDHSLEHLVAVNKNLKRYNEIFMGPQHFDYLVHLDTDDLVTVYRWRLQQEHALWSTKGAGMTDEEVVEFVKSYMPAYELYIEQLRRGMLARDDSILRGQLRVVLDVERRVFNVNQIL